jgi:hypothetical protein
MNLLFGAFVVLICLFAAVLLFGAPYLPTKKVQIDTALKLLALNRGQTLLELGCGDGRVMRQAAKQGIHSIGYELNPLLVLIAKIVTWKHRKYATVVWGNYWTAKWPPADGVFTFLLDKYMNKLDKKMIQFAQQSNKQIKLASFAFKIKNKQAKSQKNGIYLYIYK